MRSASIRPCAALLLVLSGCAPPTAGGNPSPADRVTGTWVGRDGEFKIDAVAATTIRVEFRGEHEYVSAAGPMASVGTGEGMAVLDGAHALFRPSGADAECAITLRFGRDRMEATQAGSCGFGLNVTAAGRYRRVSRVPPLFGLP